MKIVNLARRPFINRRPVVRVAMILWGAGIVLSLVALWLFASYWGASADYRERLAEVDAEIEREQQALDAGFARLQSLGMASRNAKVRQINRLIERRTFPWSQLFDDLEDVIPLDVRISSVSPSLGEAEVTTRRATRTTRARTPAEARARARGERSAPEPQPIADAVEPETIPLELPGTARTEDAMLDFIDALYAHPRFRDPFLSGESKENNEVRFSISVQYLPPRPERAPPTVVVADAGDGDDGDVDALADADLEIDPAEGGAPPSRTARRTGSGAGSEASGSVAADAARPGGSSSSSSSATGPATGPSVRSADAESVRGMPSTRRDPSEPGVDERASDRGVGVGSGASDQATRDRATRRPSSRPSTSRSSTSRTSRRSAGSVVGDGSDEAGSTRETTRRSTSSRRPLGGTSDGTGDDADAGADERRREPTNRRPSASSSPRLFGELPGVLHWLLPDVEHHLAQEREVAT